MAAEPRMPALSFRQALQLTKEGEDAAVNGSPEAIVFGHVPIDGGILSEQLDQLSGSNAKVGLNKAVQNKWLQVVKEPPTEAEMAAAAAAAGVKKKDAAKKRVLRAVGSIEDVVQAQLKSIQAGSLPPDADLDVLKKRGLATMLTIKSLKVSAGPQVTTNTPGRAAEHSPMPRFGVVASCGSTPSRISPRSMQTGAGRRRQTYRMR